MQTIIGTCSICRGPVTMATVWRGTLPPKPACESCGATQADGFGPIIKMESATRLVRDRDLMRSKRAKQSTEGER